METAKSSLYPNDQFPYFHLLSPENCPNYSYLIIDFERSDDVYKIPKSSQRRQLNTEKFLKNIVGMRQ